MPSFPMPSWHCQLCLSWFCLFETSISFSIHARRLEPLSILFYSSTFIHVGDKTQCSAAQCQVRAECRFWFSLRCIFLFLNWSEVSDLLKKPTHYILRKYSCYGTDRNIDLESKRKAWWAWHRVRFLSSKTAKLIKTNQFRDDDF